jgi:hypothetical protein
MPFTYRKQLGWFNARHSPKQLDCLKIKVCKQVGWILTYQCKQLVWSKQQLGCGKKARLATYVLVQTAWLVHFKKFFQSRMVV